MKLHEYCLIVAASVGLFTNAQAQRETAASSATATAPTRNFAEPTQSTGSIIKKDIKWKSKIPLNKTYGELSEAQKTALHSMYETLEPGDEPPFPEKGIKPIFSQVRYAQRVLQARGELNMVVTVGPDGKAIKVEDFGTVRNKQMTDTTQQVLLLTTYKPGICKGAPCTRQFKFVQQLKGG